MTVTYTFHEIARLPLPGDNVAITTQRLEAGTRIQLEQGEVTLDQTILEGHRFAVKPIPAGEPLLSWELPFGYATRDIRPGEYVCNEAILGALALRNLDFALPDEPNFEDDIRPYALDEAAFRPAEQLPLYAEKRTFLGYRRSPERGVGTRNCIVLLGTTSRTGSFVKQLETRLKPLAAGQPNLDGIVAVAHTEGGSAPNGNPPNNRELLLRTLAGFMVNPNVAAVLAVDYGVEPITNDDLRTYLQEHDYPIDEIPHAFISLKGSFLDNLSQCEEIVRGWLPEVTKTPRTEESLAGLKVGLQCGGSDAFSGISANPLLGWVVREIVRYGGAANLAETDELIGAERYVLAKVSDLVTARKFLATIERFKERVAWHGHTAEGNPSGGNKFRGLYNIVLKSIGAARKKDPDQRLDYVIDYSERMLKPGYYFMDSPGNDLESVAGQIGAGCNMIFFTTGNGSITNFPFVPTIKMVTTSRRYRLLTKEMDVNAGLYLEGVPMDKVGGDTLDLTVRIASGELSAGERAGHSQVQIWRNWQQTDSSHLEELQHAAKPEGHSIPLVARATTSAGTATSEVQVRTVRTDGRRAAEQVGLVLPTSLCAGQVARMTAARLNQRQVGQDQGISRFVALVHTEGCGNSAGASEELYIRTMLGYLTHPMVGHCLLLEHGCEKTHNDYMRNEMQRAGLDPSTLGFASVQLDGGIELVMDKIESWFQERITAAPQPVSETAGLGSLRLALASSGPLGDAAARSLGELAAAVVGAGGTVVVPQTARFLGSQAFLAETIGSRSQLPTLAYGEPIAQAGFHIMETPTEHWVETLTGLGAVGAEYVVVYVGEHPVQSHPLVPVIQVSAEEQVQRRYGYDLDLFLEGDPAGWNRQILGVIEAISRDDYAPKLYAQGNIDFQVTRGLLGVSM